MFENRVQYTPPSFGPFVWRKWWVLEPGCISKSCSKSAWSMSMTWLWTDLWWRLTCLWIAYSNPWKNVEKIENLEIWDKMRQISSNCHPGHAFVLWGFLQPYTIINRGRGSFAATALLKNPWEPQCNWKSFKLEPQKRIEAGLLDCFHLVFDAGLATQFWVPTPLSGCEKKGVGVPPWNLWIEEPQSAMIRKIWLATQKVSSLHPSALRKTQRTTESMTRKRLWNSGSVFAPFTSSSKVKSPVPVTSWG
jgi:hypothetical protein